MNLSCCLGFIKIYLLVPFHPSYPMDPRISEGLSMLEAIWYGLAIRIVNLAIEVYGLDDEQASALKDIYCRQNDYIAELDS